MLPDSRLFAFATDDDCVFGILQSRIHEVWALRKGARHGAGDDPTYNNRECFETFPFPKLTDTQREAIAAAARELDSLRNNWLNPPEWTRTEMLEFPGSTDGPWRRYIDPTTVRDIAEENTPWQSRGLTNGANDNAQGTSQAPTAPGSAGGRVGIGTVRYPRVVAKDEECAKQLKKRTLTSLYNERPTWLDLAHKNLDAAVFAAYDWDAAMSDEELLAALLALNLEREAGEK